MFAKKGELFMCHEFHYAQYEITKNFEPLFQATNALDKNLGYLGIKSLKID